MSKARVRVKLDIEVDYPDTMNDTNLCSAVSDCVRLETFEDDSISPCIIQKSTTVTGKMEWVAVNKSGFPEKEAL
jgi:hypothetical protein